MNLSPSRPFAARIVSSGTVVSLATLVIVFALGACSKQDHNKTAGQQIDSAIAKTEQAAEQVKIQAQQSAAEAKAKTESAMATAGTTLKNVVKTVETSAKDAAGKMGDKLDDVSITTSVTAAIAKESDLSLLKIKVDTRDGAVTLNGSASTHSAREKAGVIAKTVMGVLSVDNKLTVIDKAQ